MTHGQCFWAVVALFVLCELVLTLHGIDTFLWRFKTPAELVIQQRLATCDTKERK